MIKQDGKYLLIDRKNFPFGFAGPAGHIEGSETPEVAIAREVKEAGFTKIGSLSREVV